MQIWETTWPVLDVKIPWDFRFVILIQYFSSVLQYFSSVLQCSIHQLVKLALNLPTQYSKFGNVIRNNQNKLGNCALKSDLKSTVTLQSYPTSRETSQNHTRFTNMHAGSRLSIILQASLFNGGKT